MGVWCDVREEVHVHVSLSLSFLMWFDVFLMLWMIIVCVLAGEMLVLGRRREDFDATRLWCCNLWVAFHGSTYTSYVSACR